ncbi:type II secretion system protein [Gordonibacter urolithinfaciens]|uniref:type II secretion system protein n=1 Tax=Gordonibacter urolithinfaciens TaxID=1335613 RepID=UPI003AAD9814
MIKRIREEKGGFTLAELLIVVAIILVLVAVAVPVFMGAQDEANKAVGQSAERSIKAAAAVDYTFYQPAGAKDGEKIVYHAKVNKKGDVTDLTAGKGGTAYTDYVALGKAIGGSDTGIDIQVTLEPTDLPSKPTA